MSIHTFTAQVESITELTHDVRQLDLRLIEPATIEFKPGQFISFELPHPERCLLVAARGDEVLDWREMVARFPGAQLRLVEGSDHALSDFDSAHLDAVIEFLQPA